MQHRDEQRKQALQKERPRAPPPQQDQLPLSAIEHLHIRLERMEEFARHNLLERIKNITFEVFECGSYDLPPDIIQLRKEVFPIRCTLSGPPSKIGKRAKSLPKDCALSQIRRLIYEVESVLVLDLDTAILYRNERKLALLLQTWLVDTGERLECI